MRLWKRMFGRKQESPPDVEAESDSDRRVAEAINESRDASAARRKMRDALADLAHDLNNETAARRFHNLRNK